MSCSKLGEMVLRGTLGTLCALVAVALVAAAVEAARHDSVENAEKDAAAIMKGLSTAAGVDMDYAEDLGDKAASETGRSEKEVSNFFSGKGIDEKSGRDADSDPTSQGSLKQGEKRSDKSVEDDKIDNEDKSIASDFDSFVQGEDPKVAKEEKPNDGHKNAHEEVEDGKKELKKAKEQLAAGVKESKEARDSIEKNTKLREEALKKKAEASKAESDAQKAVSEVSEKSSEDEVHEKKSHDDHDEKKHPKEHGKHGENVEEEGHGEKEEEEHGGEHSSQHDAKKDSHEEESGGGVREKEASAKSGVKTPEKQDDIDKGIDDFGSQVEKFLGLHRPPPRKNGHGHGHDHGGHGEHGEHSEHSEHEEGGHEGNDESHESGESEKEHEAKEKQHAAEEKEKEAKEMEVEAKKEAAEKKALEERIRKDQVKTKDGKSEVIEGQQQSRSLGEDEDDREERLAQEKGKDDKTDESTSTDGDGSDSDKDGFDLFGDDDEKEPTSQDQQPEPDTKAKPGELGVDSVQKSDESTVPTPVTEVKRGDDGSDDKEDDDDDYKASREQDVIPIQNKLEAELNFAKRMTKLYRTHARKTSHKLFNEWQIAVKEDERIPWGRVLKEAHKHFSNGTAQEMERAVAKEDPMAIDEKYEQDAKEETAYDLLTLEDCFRMWLESVRRLKAFRKSTKETEKAIKERDEILKSRGLHNWKLVSASMVSAVKFINAGRAECRPNELPPLMDYSPLSMKVDADQMTLDILFDHAVVTVSLSADGKKATSSKPEPCQIGGLDAYVNFDVGSSEILDAAGAVAEALNDLSSQCEGVKPSSYVSNDIVVQNAQTKAVNGLLIRADLVVKARPLEVLLYARYMVSSDNSVGENDLSILKTQPDVCEFLGGKKGQYKVPSMPVNGTHAVPLHASTPPQNNTDSTGKISAAPSSGLNRVSGNANSTATTLAGQSATDDVSTSPGKVIPVTANMGGAVANTKRESVDVHDDKTKEAPPATGHDAANPPQVASSNAAPSLSNGKLDGGKGLARGDGFDDRDDDEDDEGDDEDDDDDDMEKALEEADASERGNPELSEHDGSDSDDSLRGFRRMSSLVQLGADVKPPVKLQEDRPSEFKSVRFGKAKMQRDINGIVGVRDVGLDENSRKSKIPEKFHSFEEWPACKTPVFDQGRCGAGYAFATVDALQTRLCIRSGGRMTPRLSPQDLVNCDSSEFGCDGGFPYKAFDYLENVGVVSESCRAYVGKTEECNRGKCDDREVEDHNPYYSSGRYKFRNYSTRYTESGSFNEEVVQRAIMEGGPVVAGMDLYPGFMSLREAVYSPPESVMVSGSKGAHLDSKQLSIGAHTVMLVGWETIEGVKYWIAKNSLGHQWGDKGYFLIRRGVNSCNIENFILWAEAERPCALQNDCSGHGSCVYKEEGKSLKWGDEEIEDQVFNCACDNGWDGESCSHRVGTDESKVSEDATKLVNQIENKTEKEYDNAQHELDKSEDTDDQSETDQEIAEIGEEMNALGTGHEKGEPDHPDKEQDKLYAEQINNIRSGRNKYNTPSASAATSSNGDAVMATNESTSAGSVSAVTSAVVVALASLVALLL